MTEWKDWDRDLWIMQTMERNCAEISVHLANIERLARMLPEIPQPAVGPCRSLRNVEQTLSVGAALLRSVRERYETRPVRTLEAAE